MAEGFRQSQDDCQNNKDHGVLSGQIALVTGAGRGIGREIAISLGKAGAHVACVSRTRSEIEEVARFITSTFGSRAHAFPCDLSDVTNIPELIEAVRIWAEGPIQILVNNAGVARIESIHCGLDMNIWQTVMSTNLLAPVALINQVLPPMITLGRGCIISIGSRNAVYDMPFMSSYSASKTALLRFHHTLECETIGTGVYNYYLQPGNIESTILSETGAVDSNSLAHVDGIRCMLDQISRIRKISPEVVGENCVQLASGFACELSGRYVDLDRGLPHVLDDFRRYKGTTAQKDGLFKLGMGY